MRFGSFLIISIIFTKSSLSTVDIGVFEMFNFIASFLSFFWITGLVQSFLPLYNNNLAFRGKSGGSEGKSPEIFNAFLLLTFFSLVFFFLALSLKNHFSVFGIHGNVPFINLLLAYILLSNPGVLVEYVYLLRDRSYRILQYGFITYFIQIVIVTGPILLGYGIVWAIWGLIVISVVRLVWLAVLMVKYAEFRFSFSFIREHLHLGAPLIISALLSGSSQYIGGIIISNKFDAEAFAKFRFGAKELPFVLLLANALSNAMLPEFSKQEKRAASLQALRKKSERLIHILYPITILFLLFAYRLYPVIFNENFHRSADVFVVYLLLILSRLLFPQTILIGLKNTRIILVAATIEIILNLYLSLAMVDRYGMVGVAVATVIVYLVEKILLIIYTYFKYKIRPNDYIPLKWYFIHSFVLVLIFVLIDHGIIRI
jgi:O-antigen/teichoic acid export membrane protein